MKNTPLAVFMTICCVIVLEFVYIKSSTPLTLIKTISAIRKFPNANGLSTINNSTSYRDQVKSLRDLDDSLADKHSLLWKEYCYYSLKNKLSRSQTISRVKEMKDIMKQRLEIEHKIDSISLLNKQNP